jgi:hypothetical protein
MMADLSSDKRRLLYAEIVRQTATVRKAQKAYFKNRTTDNLLTSKVEEALLDRMLKEAGHG